MTRLFLDCEWADANASQLVSLGLVDASETYSFYAEMSPLPASPTDFVRDVVYPLLDHGWHSMPTHEFTRQLRLFLARVPEPVMVMFDNPEDGRLFQEAVSGVRRPANSGGHSADPHIWPWDSAVNGLIEPVETGMPQITTTLVTFGDVIAKIELYFEENPAEFARRHHALVDAKALAWGFTEALTPRI